MYIHKCQKQLNANNMHTEPPASTNAPLVGHALSLDAAFLIAQAQADSPIPEGLRVDTTNQQKNTAEARIVCPFANCSFVHNHSVTILNDHLSSQHADEQLPEILILPWQMRACRQCYRMICSRAAAAHHQSCPAIQSQPNTQSRRSGSSRTLPLPAITRF